MYLGYVSALFLCLESFWGLKWHFLYYDSLIIIFLYFVSLIIIGKSDAFFIPFYSYSSYFVLVVSFIQQSVLLACLLCV